MNESVVTSSAGGRPLRHRILALVLVASIFVLGIVVGVVGTHVAYARRIERPGALADLALDLGAHRLERQLDLDTEQRLALDRILAEARREIALLRGDVVVRMRAMRQKAFDELAPVLDDDQRAELERLQAQRERFFDRYLAPVPDAPAEGDR